VGLAAAEIRLKLDDWIAAVKRLIERHIRPELGRHKVAAVTRQDLAKLHRSLAETPRQANFVLAVCSKAFSLAELWAMRTEGTNPCRKIERYDETERERFLSADELARLGATLRQAVSVGLPGRSPPAAPIRSISRSPRTAGRCLRA
jgi:hypothetical protein